MLRLDAERAHGLALVGLRAAGALPCARRRLAARYRVEDPRLEQRVLGRRFPNPIGLAAGFDKDGVAIASFAALGFGFVEVGTVTPRPQPGNPRPRLFRHPEQASLQNAMGFNNRGLKALARRLTQRRGGDPLGVNIGRNKDTAPDRQTDDYRQVAARLSGCCDYFVINVSSPNTPGLRDLEERDRLRALLEEVRGATETPFLVKLSPDLEPEEAIVLATVSLDGGATGVVLTNTTVDYALLPGSVPPGGLSGRVLRRRSFEMLHAVARELFGRCLLISVGGVETPEEIYRRLRHGASLVQLYTALVYGGPRLLRYLNEGLLRLLERDGARSIAEVIGADLPSGPEAQEHRVLSGASGPNTHQNSLLA
ncbi:MAG: quinone-dependent dihydroorotate dehydrogenase [Thermoanaerobaculia bacterium]